MSTQEQTVGYRRNGRQQACEPCRKGKLRCDHGAPHCGRCVRLKNTHRCSYHPAPMTRTQTQETSHSNASSRPSHSKSHSSQSLPHNNAATQTAHAKSQHHTHVEGSIALHANLNEPTHQRNNQSNWKKAEYPRSSRYYGPTSFQAVFSEEFLPLGEGTRKHPGTWVFGPPLLGRQRPNTPDVRVAHTLKALCNLPSKDTCLHLVESFKSMHDATLDKIMIRYCITSLWTHFGAALEARTEKSLSVISDALFNNEEILLPPAPDDGMEWLGTFNGLNIRFEMLGVLFCFLGLSYHFLQDADTLFLAKENEGRNRRETTWRMKECADVCLNMCNAAEIVNSLVTALVFNLKILESGCVGDEWVKIRRLNGEMITSAISSGLHKLPDYAFSKHTAASEFKKRLFSAVYCSDKNHSSLNGIPPLLLKRYCVVEPCLDLDPAVLYSSTDEISAAFTRLDLKGWNTANDFFDTTLLRAKVQLSTLREDVLELSLGTNTAITLEIVNNLLQRSRELFASFPSQLHYYSHEKVPKDTTGVLLYEQAYLMLQSLQDVFLINRVAVARGVVNGQGLLDVAMEMLDIVIMFWMKRDELMIFSAGFDWIITYYGIPCAGVICTELLRQSSRQTTVKFSRSDAIQKLTLFIGFLDWIRPSHGNFTLASRLKGVVKSVLDHVLAAPTPPIPPEETFEQLPLEPLLLSDYGMQDLDWLNTIDWTQGPWMDFS